jgi:peptide/nickel transport system ATP-binding protein
MRQRVMIAIALSCDPKLLIADEPTTALDVTIQAQILELLTTMQRDRKMAMVLISHDLSLVAGRTDRVAVMYAGRVVEYAPTAKLFADMRMPYTEALMRAIPRMDAPRDAELAGIPGRPPDLIDPPPGCAFAPRCDYAQSRCHEERPPLTESESESDHSYACWYPVGTPEGEEALARNRGSETTTMVALERPT